MMDEAVRHDFASVRARGLLRADLDSIRRNARVWTRARLTVHFVCLGLGALATCLMATFASSSLLRFGALLILVGFNVAFVLTLMDRLRSRWIRPILELLLEEGASQS